LGLTYGFCTIRFGRDSVDEIEEHLLRPTLYAIAIDEIYPVEEAKNYHHLLLASAFYHQIFPWRRKRQK
jgi:hypothetical protein